MVGTGVPGPGPQRRIHRLEPGALPGRVRRACPPAPAGTRAPGAPGHGAACHRRAEQDFRPDKNRNITHQQARAIDSAIDQYNDAIQEHVRRARAAGRDWHLVDLCGILDGVAYRRYIDDPVASAAQQDWQPYALPAPIAGLDTRFYRSDETGRLQGGLFGLDAVHPTTAGYGVIAQAVLDVLYAAGVASPGIDFTQLLAQDTLNSNPPALFTRIFTLLAPFLTRLASAPASTGVA